VPPAGLVRWPALWLLGRLDLGGITRQMAEEMLSKTVMDQLLMHPLGQGMIGELIERTRELGFARSWSRRSQPQMRRSERSVSRRSVSATVVGVLSIALPTKAHAIAERSSAARPGPRDGEDTQA
jgi:hypothetical protein